MRELLALLAFVRLGWHGAVAQRAAILARGGLYALVLAIWWQLWQATPLGELGRADVTPEGLLWYVAVTEWIVFAAGMPYREIEADIRDGRIATALTRPVGYGAAMYAQWLGEVAYRLLVLGALGFAAAWWLAGAPPMAPARWAAIAASGCVATAVLLVWQYAIGMTAAWAGAAAPLYWIWQKLVFVLGGLLMPVSLYPPVMRAIAEATPFPALIHAPASLAFDPAASFLPILVPQLFWLAATAVLAAGCGRLALRRLLARGV